MGMGRKAKCSTGNLDILSLLRLSEYWMVLLSDVSFPPWWQLRCSEILDLEFHQGCQLLLGQRERNKFEKTERGISGKGPAEGLKAIMEQVFEGSHTREHTVRTGLIPLSSLVTEGALVLGWGLGLAMRSWGN